MLGALLLLPLAAGCAALERLGQNWWDLRRDSSGQAPDPAATPDAVIQIYAARTVGWRGVMAVHTWVTLKPAGALTYTRYEVMGWGVGNGAPARGRSPIPGTRSWAGGSATGRRPSG